MLNLIIYRRLHQNHLFIAVDILAEAAAVASTENMIHWIDKI
jgi:hypothetical protein